MWEAPSLDKLQEAIASPSHPIGMRMRAAYFLRQAYDNATKNGSIEHHQDEDEKKECSDDKNDMQQIHATVIETLGKGLSNKEHGSLMRHEFAYVMGQLRDPKCCPVLEQVLSDNDDCVMVRHECAEALGAIGEDRSITILQAAIKDNPHKPEIHQTCEIAIDHMKWRLRQLNNETKETDDEEPMACACMISPYSSIDPAPPHPKHVHLSTSEIGSILQNVDLPLFERYRAMFSLRNRGGEDAVLELGNVLVHDQSSALLRHEIAYVLGQMQHPASIEALGESLRRPQEHEMVRHESAEALGAIDDYERWSDCEALLMEFMKDDDVVVRESCMVALDAADYWGHANSNSEETNEDGDTDLENECKDENENNNLSFGMQKAISNGKKETFLNHFNVQA